MTATHEIGIYVYTRDGSAEDLLDEACCFGEYLEGLYSEPASVDEDECIVETLSVPFGYFIRMHVETEIDPSCLLDAAHDASHLGRIDESDTYVETL
jgi:hypothetical protein